MNKKEFESFIFLLCWFLLCVACFQFSSSLFIIHFCLFHFVLSPSFFFVLKVFFFFPSSPSFFPPPSFLLSFLSSLLFCAYFFMSCVSLFCHAIDYSLFHASPCCLFYPSHFTLLLHVLSLTFYLATTSSLPLCFPTLLPIPSFVFCFVVVCSFPHTSLCSCLLPPLHFTLQLPNPSFMLGLVVTCSFLCTSPYYCLLLPSCFALLPTYSFTPHPMFNLKTKILLPLPPPCCFTTCSFTLHLDVCLVSTSTSPPLSFLQVKELGLSLELEAFLFW